MSKTLIILFVFWFIGNFKYVLFWLYLWQLKEYHIGRFLDHFETYKGKKLLFSWLLLFKIILIFFLIIASQFSSLLFLFLFLIYFSESIIFFRQLYLRSTKKPVKTVKSLFLTGFSFLIIILFLYWARNKNVVWLLAFDILTPIIISAVVLFFQPISVLGRKIILKQARQKLEKFKNLKIIAITGSYGKTSTKEFLAIILSKKFKVLSTSKHQNSEIGVANCILNDLTVNHQVFIAEVGAYNKGKVKEVCNVLKPKIGIVTGVNEQHLALFGSLENLLSAEGGRELAGFVENNGLLVVNGDNKYCLDLIKRFNPSTSSGLAGARIYSEDNKILNADIWSDSITVHKDFLSFIAIDKKGEMAHFNVRVLGKQNVQNLLAAIIVAKELGMNFGEISEACKNIKQEQAGMILKTDKHGIEIIDSSYSSNPDGAIADLDYLSIFPQKKVIIMPSLIELGNKSVEAHEKIGNKIGKVCDMAIITSKDYFEEIKKGAKEAGMSENNIIFCEKPEDIYSIITLFCKSGDTVLLEGRVPQKLHELF